MFRRSALVLAALLVPPSSGAWAFDCNKATTPSETAICADPAAHKADVAMGEAYSALLAHAPTSERAEIETAQVQWLQRRDNACAGVEGAARGACLTRESEQRRRFLTGQPEAGPGTPGRIAPLFRIEKGGPGRAALDIELLKFADLDTAAARAFNAAVDKLTSEIVEPEKDEPQADHYAYDWHMRLTYASPRLISARLDGYAYTGGAHPNMFTHNVNVDVAEGREVRFDDAFTPQAAEKVFAFCDLSVREQKKQKLGGDAPRSADDLASLAKEIRDAARDFDAWSFGPDAATIIFNAYAVGAYYEGAYACEIPYAKLREWAKPGFPLP